MLKKRLNNWKSALATFVCLSIANFLYQAFGSAPNYDVATERSFFQGIALLVAWLMWTE
jgi:hypothetical protein